MAAAATRGPLAGELDQGISFPSFSEPMEGYRPGPPLAAQPDPLAFCRFAG